MAIREENRCCGCAVPAYPCLGDSCELRHYRTLYCDKCENEVERLYKYGGDEICEECLLKEFEVIE